MGLEDRAVSSSNYNHVLLGKRCRHWYNDSVSVVLPIKREEDLRSAFQHPHESCVPSHPWNHSTAEAQAGGPWEFPGQPV